MISIQASFILKTPGDFAFPNSTGLWEVSHTLLTRVPRTLHLATGKTEVGAEERKMLKLPTEINYRKMSFPRENPTVQQSPYS